MSPWPPHVSAADGQTKEGSSEEETFKGGEEHRRVWPAEEAKHVKARWTGIRVLQKLKDLWTVAGWKWAFIKSALNFLLYKAEGNVREAQTPWATCPGSHGQQGPRADVRAEVQETLGRYRIQVRPLCLWELLRDWTDNSDRVVKENEQEYPDLHLSCSWPRVPLVLATAPS